MKETNPKISIIVPVYNVEQYLSRCVDSILAQEFTDFELLLVEDGSPDRCGQICDEYARHDARIRVFHKPNGGVSSARNVGIKEARGDYFWFVDSDDYVLTGSFDIIFKAVQTEEADVYEFAFNRDNKKCSLANESFSLHCNDRIIRFYLRSPKFHLWNKIFSKKIINEVFFIEGIAIGEDFLFNLSVFNKSKSFIYIDRPIYQYFDNRDGSAMSTVSEEVWSKNMNIVFDYIANHRNNYSPKNYSAIPSVFLSRKNIFSVIFDKSRYALIEYIKKEHIVDILNSNCVLRQKAYLLFIKCFSCLGRFVTV